MDRGTDKVISAFEIELNRIDWSELREADGSAAEVPDALRALLNAESADDVDNAYWRLENHVVLQGSLFEAAAYTVPVLLAGLVDPKPRPVRIGVLELLFQIVAGEPHPEEVERGNTDLAETCREKARQGIWLLYGEFVSGGRGVRDAAEEVLGIIESEQARLDAFRKATR